MSGRHVVLGYVISTFTNSQWSHSLAQLVVSPTGLHFVSVLYEEMALSFMESFEE